MRCSNRKRISRSIRVRWLARPPLCGAKWWHSSTISKIPRGVGDVPAAVRLGVRPGPGRLEELLQHVGHPQVVHRRDDAGERLPGVGVDPQAAAKLEGRVGVDDLEVEVELAAKLVLPLPLEHGRAEDEDAPDAPPQEQFFEDQAGLDRLAEADAVGQEQADTGHRQGPQDRLQLVGVDLDGRVPDAEERLVLDALGLPQPVQPGPAVGVDERLQRRRGCRAGWRPRRAARSCPAPWPWPRPPRAAARLRGSGSRRGTRPRRRAGDLGGAGVVGSTARTVASRLRTRTAWPTSGSFRASGA